MLPGGTIVEIEGKANPGPVEQLQTLAEVAAHEVKYLDSISEERVAAVLVMRLGAARARQIVTLRRELFDGRHELTQDDLRDLANEGTISMV